VTEHLPVQPHGAPFARGNALSRAARGA
jgi:hypothetical protein